MSEKPKTQKKKKAKEQVLYYQVVFDDGDMDVFLHPDEDDEDFPDYDNSDLKQVKAYAATIHNAEIRKVTKVS